jgi:hypothetical protein
LTARFRRLDGGASNSLECDKPRAVFSNNSDREAQEMRRDIPQFGLRVGNVAAFPLSGARKPSAAGPNSS